MILGADAQNKNLSDAAKKRIDTSPRTRTSNALAAKISSSKSNGSEQSSVVHSSRSSLSESKPDPVKGSKEGLMDGSSTTIQMSEDGYDNPKIQKARYEQSEMGFKQKLNISNKLNFNSKKNDIINNQSSKFNLNSSAYMLKEHLQADSLLGR
jgi:hypothetical protein